MAAVWECDVEPDARFLLMAMADHADENGGSIFPSIGRLSRKTGFHERKVQRLLARLRRRGFLVVTRPAAGHRPTEYRIAFDPPRGDTTCRGDTGVGATELCHPTPDIAVSPQGRQSFVTQNHQVTVREPSERRSTSSDDFDRFWTAYPKKAGKLDAQRAWGSTTRARPAIDEVLAAVERQKASAAWQRDGGQFIPHPATWLRAGRWDDEAPAAAAVPPISPRMQEAMQRVAEREGRRAERGTPRGTPRR